MRHAFVDIKDKTMCSRCGNEVKRVDEECLAISDGQMHASPLADPGTPNAVVKRLNYISYFYIAHLSPEDRLAIIEAADLIDRLAAQRGRLPDDVEAKIWNRFEELIDKSPTNGISAEGRFNERIADNQRSYIEGLRTGRLAARNIIRKSRAVTPAPDVVVVLATALHMARAAMLYHKQKDNCTSCTDALYQIDAALALAKGEVK